MCNDFGRVERDCFLPLWHPKQDTEGVTDEKEEL